MEEASLYIHVPFCAGCCDYCDFYSIPVKPNDSRIAAYITRLLLDAALLFAEYSPASVPTVYVGGGTPSLLGPSGIARLLDGIAAFLPAPPEELTVEANPESADRAFLEACRAHGTTRISLGVQTFHEPSRRLVHRVGEGVLLPERLALTANIFPGAFSADLITGLPGQDETVLLRDIEKLLDYSPAHVSLYALTVEEGTPLARKQALASKQVAGKQVLASKQVASRQVAARQVGRAAGPEARLPPAEEADRLWILGRDTLEQAGYEQYEVSNFAQDGKESRHNARYWRMESWLALGPAASATIIGRDAGNDTGTGARRWTVTPDVDAWLARGAAEQPPVITETLDPLTLLKETFMMGFRTKTGLDPALFERRFRLNPEAAAPFSFARWRERGLLQPEKPALTKAGLLLLDRFLVECFAELETLPDFPAQ
jgi:oxygen-independent coproporphyrinogen-3 oxidase